MKSSYVSRHYGTFLQSLVMTQEPECCIECGILEGYSTIILSHALKKIGNGHLYAYDIFEDYAYARADYDKIAGLIYKHGLNDVITLRKKSLFDAAGDFRDVSIDFLHIDISNTGDIIRDALRLFDPKIKPGKLILFEGGSPLRDRVGWMDRYGKEPLFPEIGTSRILRDNYTFIVLHPYPSMLICSKNLSVNDETWKHFGYDAHGHFNEISEEDLFEDILK